MIANLWWSLAYLLSKFVEIIWYWPKIQLELPCKLAGGPEICFFYTPTPYPQKEYTPTLTYTRVGHHSTVNKLPLSCFFLFFFSMGEQKVELFNFNVLIVCVWRANIYMSSPPLYSLIASSPSALHNDLSIFTFSLTYVISMSLCLLIGYTWNNILHNNPLKLCNLLKLTKKREQQDKSNF